jgi:hypothetical protein
MLNEATTALMQVRPGLGWSVSAEQACGQVEQGFDQRKRRLHADSEKTEWQGDQPDERRDKGRQQSQWPANDQQQAPKKKQSDDSHGSYVHDNTDSAFGVTEIFSIGCSPRLG